jgi:exonuclease SbcC
MIPIELSIQGFLSYQEPVKLNFESFHLACISGPNGAGKSSILDAMTWVLFGKARSSNDNIINQNSKNAEIDFVFEYENQRFRIMRSKTIEKSQILEFFVFDNLDNKYRALTEHNSTETQKRINATLRMDYDTFTNASFFLQGKADQFTQLSPGQRKEILSNILGLEIWETYRDIAKDERRKMEFERKRIEVQLEEITQEINREEEIQAQLTVLEKDLTDKTALKNSLNNNLMLARQLDQARKNLDTLIKNKKNDLEKKFIQLQQRQNKSEQLKKEIERLSEEIEQAPTIEKNFQRWKEIRSDLETWDNKSLEYSGLDNRIKELNHTIELKKNKYQLQLENLQKEHLSIVKIQETLPVLQSQKTEFSDNLIQLDQQLSKRDEKRKSIEEYQQEKAGREVSLKHLEAINTELRQHLIAFKNAGPDCPFCAQPLTPAHRQKYESLVNSEGVERKIKIDEHKEKIQTLSKKIASLNAELTDLNQLEKEQKLLHQRITEYETLIKSHTDTLATWGEEKAGLLISIPEILKKESFAKAAQEDISKLQPQLDALAYDQVSHQQMRDQEKVLRDVEKKYNELEKARSTFIPLKSQLIDYQKEAIAIEKDISEIETELGGLQQDFETQFSNLTDIAQLQNQINDVQIEISRLEQQVGAHKQMLNVIDINKERRKKYLAEKNELVSSIARYLNLEEAFSKNGIPALLIEQALPEIEEHTNQLLEKLSDGGMSIYFQTQSDYKDKKRADKKETLDILINDSSGRTRAYEMFSGGEAFRINFAIRLALSQVLANRAGAQLQTLVIDEGFGSQDREGRQRLIESINQIRQEFSKILVITHLEELKDAFPARIEVEKTISGSKIEVQII